MKPSGSPDRRRDEVRATLTLPLLLLAALVASACLSWGALKAPVASSSPAESSMSPPRPGPTARPEDAAPVVKSEAEWRRLLSPLQFHVLREKGTERAFTGEYTDTETVGTYCCAGCGAELFLSDAKFHSGCGWPAFFQPLEDARLIKTEDTSHGMLRTEVCCRRCGGHLGHVFDDGPPPTHLRFCINSASIKLRPADPRARPPR